MAIYDADSQTFKSVVKRGISVVVFWAPWNEQSKKTLEMVKDIEKELNGDINLVKVNIDESLDLVKMYSINSIPTILILKNSGMEEKIMGTPFKDDLFEKVNSYLSM